MCGVWCGGKLFGVCGVVESCVWCLCCFCDVGCVLRAVCCVVCCFFMLKFFLWFARLCFSFDMWCFM